MSEQKPSHEVEGIARRAPRQDCVEAQIWGRVPKHFCSIEDPQEHNGLHHSGRSLEPPRLFLELAARPNWAIGGEGPWSGRWPKTLWSLWLSSRVPLRRWENLPEGQSSLQHITNWAFMAEWPDRSHSSVKVTWQPALPKGTKRLSDHEKLDSLWPDCQAQCLEETWHHPYSEASWWQHHAVGMFFSCSYWETSQDQGKDERSKVQRYPRWKPAPERSGPQT